MRRRFRNPMPLSGSGVITFAAILAVVQIGLSAYRWYQKNRDSLLPKSAAEKEVDTLYGPGQGWKNAPVYNTPGKPGYIPTLPASYAPGTKPAGAITRNPFDTGKAVAGPTADDAMRARDASMTGLGRWI